MKTLIALAFATLMAAPSFAEDTAVKTQNPDGSTTETKSDSMKNPITGNTTVTHESETKDAGGNVVAKSKKKMKHGKDGKLLDKKMESESTTKTE